MSSPTSSEPAAAEGVAGKGNPQASYDPSTCCTCGGSETRPVSDGPIIPIVVCTGCGLMRQGPRDAPNKISIVDFSGGLERMRQQRLEKETTQVVDYLRALPELERLLPEKGRLLEIGCATGVLLNRTRERGWDVIGIEPEDWSCELARSQYDLRVENALFQDAGIEDGSMDAALLFHVIEHLPDPLDGLRVIRSMLRPGGVLVCETPRYDTLTFKVLKGRERSVIPGHLWYFTRPTLRALAEKAGFEVAAMHSVGRTLTLDRLCYSVSKVLNTRVTTRMLTAVSNGLGLNRFRVHINLHDMMRLYLRRTD